MTDQQVFGRVVTGTDVERAVLDTLKAWMREYLAWVERHAERSPRSLQMPRSWVSATEVERWPEEQLPSVLVLNTGLAEPPERDGEGAFRASFAVGIAVIVSAKDRAETDELSKLYVTAIRAALLQHPSLGGFADAVEWVDENYDALPAGPGGSRRRQLAAGQVVFRVTVGDVLVSPGGPTAPRDNPYEEPEWPFAETVEVTIEPK